MNIKLSISNLLQRDKIAKNEKDNLGGI